MSSVHCTTCEKTFSSVEDLHKHMENSSGCGKSYPCQFCGKCFVTSYHLMIHTRQHCGNKLHQCELCGRDFSSFVRLKRHWSLHDGTNPNMCHVCGEQFTNSEMFRRHMMKCRETCQEQHGRRQQLGNVVAKLSEKLTKLLTCHLCQKMTDSLAEMHEHKLTHHSDYCNSLQATPAAVASSEVFDSKKLSRHESCLCSVCGKIFVNSVTLKRHVMTLHPDTIEGQSHNNTTTGGKGFECPKCHKYFARPRQHTRCHGEAAQFCCKECNRPFFTRCALKAHERCHTDHEKKFHCKVCGRQYKMLASLQVHTRIHTGELPYCCQTCGRRFKDKASYQVHCRIHTGERPFLCSYCAKRFITSTDLKEHVIVMHTDSKDFQCPVCGRKFALGKAMRRHVKVRHKAKGGDN